MRLPDLLKSAVMVRAVFCLGLFLLSPNPSLAGTISVPSVGNSTIQSGIDNAADGDTVLVADNTYYERINFNGKNITVVSVNGAASTTIYGGGGGSVVTFSNSELRSAVLDGFTIKHGTAYSGGGIYCSAASPTITNCTITSNSATFGGGGIGCLNSASPAITNCFIWSNTGTASDGGGGIYIENSSPTITGCTFQHNKTGGWFGGGAMYCNNSSPVITDCTFASNRALNGYGGAIALGWSSSPTITNCTIRSNTANQSGGGIYCYSSSPTLTNCTISSNTAAGGGGIECYWYSSPTITNCTISGNTAAGGGGIECYYYSSPTITNCTISGNTVNPYGGGGIECYWYSSPTITNCTISGNTAGYGGGICCSSYSSPTITNCTISDNSASNSGGGILCANSSSPTITNCTISGNTNGMDGGGIFCVNYSSPNISGCTISGNTTGGGGGIFIGSDSQPTISNCTISGNMASGGGGILCDSSSSPMITNCTISGNSANLGIGGGGIAATNSSSPTLLNCILWGDTADASPNEVSLSGGSSITITYSDIQQDGYAGSNGNINADPLFINAAKGKFRLQAGSPCIDTGISTGAPSTDKAGTSRPQGAGYDMGAYEYYLCNIYVPDDYSTIQGAIDAAVDGCTVIVRDGTYYERINYSGKDITVRSENGAASTTINGSAGGTVVTFDNSESNSAVLSGFTVTNGSGTYRDAWGGYIGGGIICSNSSSPTITNCIIRSNTADWVGGILCEYSSSPIISNCTISRNTASNFGGGIGCGYASPTITNCTIRSNTAGWSGGGIGCGFSSSPSITNCVISSNTAEEGGGISCFLALSPAITNCTISGNTAGWYGGGIYNYSSSPALLNCILWGDTGDGNPDEIRVDSGTISVTYSDIQNNYIGTGNIYTDPLFVGGGDFHLQAASPCIDTGVSTGAPAADKDGVSRPQGAGYDMGAYEYFISCSSPAAPASINYPSSNTSGSFTVNWSAVSGATSYTLQRANNAVFTGAVMVYTGGNTSYAETGLSNGTYYYRVQAANSCGESGWEDGPAVTVSSAPSKPASISYPEVNKSGRFTVSWSAVNGAAGYVLQRSTKSDFSNAVTIYNGSGNSYKEAYSKSNKLPAGRYYYRVKAKNSGGSSGWRNGHAILIIWH